MHRTFVLWLVLTASLAGAQPVHAEDAFFDSNGVRIRYVTAGQGEAVVLIHGWMSDSSMWGRDRAGNTKLNTTGADGFQLIALDCRGHGQSAKPTDPAQYGPEVAEDVIRLLDHLKIDKAHLLGYSSGAFIAGKIAAMHPDRVLSIVFAGQAPLVGELKPTAFAEVETFAQLVDEGKDLGDYIIAVTPANKPKPSQAQAKAIAKFLFAGKDVQALALAGRGFKQLTLSVDELNQCQAPILFLHGANESDYVKNRVAIAHKLLGRGEIKTIPGGDHLTTLSKPEFTTAVLTFLKSNKTK